MSPAALPSRPQGLLRGSSLSRLDIGHVLELSFDIPLKEFSTFLVLLSTVNISSEHVHGKYILLSLCKPEKTLFWCRT